MRMKCMHPMLTCLWHFKFKRLSLLLVYVQIHTKM